jgi:hypothetical protein
MPPRDRSKQFDIDRYMEAAPPGRPGQDALEKSHGNSMRAVPVKFGFAVDAFELVQNRRAPEMSKTFQDLATVREKLANKLADRPSDEKMERQRGHRSRLEQLAKDDQLEIPDILSSTLARFDIVKEKSMTLALENQRLDNDLDTAKTSLENSRRDGLRLADDLRASNEKFLALQQQSTKDLSKFQQLEAANVKALKGLSSLRRKARHRKRTIKMLQTRASTLPGNDVIIAEHEAEVQDYIQAIQDRESEIASLNKEKEDLALEHQKRDEDYEKKKTQLDEANKRINRLFALETEKTVIEQRLKASRAKSIELEREKDELEGRHNVLRSELTAAKESAKIEKEKAEDSQSRSDTLTRDKQKLTEKVGLLESALEEQKRSFEEKEANLKKETSDAREQIRQLNNQLAALRLQSIPSAPSRRSSGASQSSSHSPATTHFPDLGQNLLQLQRGGPSTSSQPLQMLPPATTTPTSRQTTPQAHGRRASSASEVSTDSLSPGVGSSHEQSLAPPLRDPNAPLEYDFLISGTPKAGQRTNQGPAEVIALMDGRIAIWSPRTAPAHWSRPSQNLKCVNTRVLGRGKKTQGAHEDSEDPKTACTKCVSSRLPCVMAYKNSRPVVLPLPASERAPSATAVDTAYYVKARAPTVM